MKNLKFSIEEIEQRFKRVEEYNNIQGVNGLPIKFLNEIKEEVKKDIFNFNLNEELEYIPFEIILFANIELLELLFDMGLNLNSVNEDDFSLIIFLLMMNKSFFKKTLLDLSEDYEEYEFKIDTNSIEKLYENFDKKRNEMLELFLKYGADINFEDKYILTICTMGSIQSIEFLLKKGLNPNLYIDNRPIIYFFLIANEKIIEESSVNQKRDMMSIFYQDFDKKRYEIIELLLKYGADINFEDKYILTICMMGSIQSIEFLLQKGLNPNIYIDNQPIIYLLLIMSENLFEEFNHRSRDISIIYKGFNERRYEIIELLLKYGADINLKIHNLPFLYYSVIDITKDKFENILDEEKFKILKEMLNRNLENLEFLLKNGLDISEEFNGFNPLIFAIMNNKIEIVKLLLSYGADVNKKDYEGNTSLSIASEKRDIEMMKLLIEHGANIHEIILKHPLKKSKKGLNVSSAINSKLEEIANEKNLNKKNFLLNETEKINYNYLISQSILEIVYEDNTNVISQLILKALSDEEIKNILNIEYFPTDEVKKLNYLSNYFLNKIKKQEAPFTAFEKISLVQEYLNAKEKALQLLVDSGIDIDFKFGLEKNTLFLEACQENDIKVVQFCIRNGADTDIRNRIGKNGFNLTNNTEIQKVLLSRKINREEIVDQNEALRFIWISEFRTNIYLKDKDKDKEEKHKINSKEKIISTPFIEVLQSRDAKALLEFLEKVKKTREINIYLLIKDNYPIEFIEAFLRHNKSLVNNIDAYSQYSPLMLAVENDDFDMVKLLLKYGAKVNLSTKKGEALNFVKSDEIKNLLWDYWQPMETHPPKQLVKLLTNFTIDTPIKSTTHSWDSGNIKKEYGSFKEFIDAISKQWKEIEVDLKELSPNLHSKIYNFLLNPHTANWCSRTNISIGWSSLEGLELWCDEGNNPFEFKLKEHYEIENRSITTFGEVINLFKREIEMRNENNMLEHIFLEHQKKLGRKFSVKLIKLKGRTFYTDVEKFQESVSRIFEEIKKRDNEEIHIEVIEPNAESIELKITQLNSSANRSAKEMLEEIENGDFKVLKENLINLCDWSIESNDESESYRVNYLRMSQTQEIEKLTDSVDGFSHILRFYKK